MHIHHLTHHLRTLLSLGSMLCPLSACIGSPDDIDTGWQELSSRDAPYYTYDTERVFLTVDPSHITLSSRGRPSDDVVRASLGAIGLSSAALQRSSVQSDMLRLALADRTSIEDAVAIAARLRRDETFDFVANAYRVVDTGEEIELHDRLVVHLRDGAGPIEQLNSKLGTRLVLGPLGNTSEYVVAYPRGVDPLAFARIVAEQPEVEWVDPDKTSDRKLAAIPTDPFFSEQFYAQNNLSIGSPKTDANIIWAWDLTLGSWAPSAGPLIVAVVDSGVQIAHPDLGSGSILGFDAINNRWDGFGCTNCSTNPDAASGHGTAVAGIIRAQHDDGIGIAGFAPAATLLPVQIFKGSASGSDVQIALGIDAAWQNDAQVINNSWGGGSPSNAITAAINRATSQGRGGKGSVVVFAAGNTSARSSGIIGAVAYPAKLPNVLAVGAITRNGALADYTPEGPELDIVAVSSRLAILCGGEVVTTDLLGVPGCSDGPQGNIDYTSTFGGTSAAAPQVSAVAAMVISRSPTLTEAQVRSAITNNADPWSGSTTQVGAGKLNAYRALVGRITVRISGTSHPSSPGIFRYVANVTGGISPYNYQWSDTVDGHSQSVCSNSPSCDLVVGDQGRFHQLLVVVTNGPDHVQFTTGIGITEPAFVD